eukprot:scaffold438_cov110-Isochrysis_galbana.AAC.3
MSRPPRERADINRLRGGIGRRGCNYLKVFLAGARTYPSPFSAPPSSSPPSDRVTRAERVLALPRSRTTSLPRPLAQLLRLPRRPTLAHTLLATS